ncbi:MAG: hypothetical protein JSW33_07075 [bacterium]|nr:MAG: hypothetical protein JSW33_07075 [bacterium]
MDFRKKTLIYLILFAVVDMIIPIPIMTILLIYVVLEKPYWFKNMVSEIYQQKY